MRDLPRGAWPVCGEIDHGLAAGIEAACTVLFDDPIFGWTAYGGEVHEGGKEIKVIPATACGSGSMLLRAGGACI